MLCSSISFHFISEVQSMRQGEVHVSSGDISSQHTNVILVRSFHMKDQQTVCTHLGLELLPSKGHVYMPYQYDFYSADIPEVVEDCGADGDCFYRCISN